MFNTFEKIKKKKAYVQTNTLLLDSREKALKRQSKSERFVQTP